MLAARPPKSVPLTKPGLITSNLSSRAMMHCPSIPSMPNRTCSPSSMHCFRSHLTLLSYKQPPWELTYFATNDGQRRSHSLTVELAEEFDQECRFPKCWRG